MDRCGDHWTTLVEVRAAMTASPVSSVSHFERKIEALSKELSQAGGELAEARAFQTAISEILTVISRSPGNAQPVFDAIVRWASRLCGGEYAIANRFDGEFLHLVAQYNPRPGTAEETARSWPRRATREQSIGARAILDGTVVNIPDLDTAGLEPELREFHRRIGARSVVCAPMICQGRPVGVISVSRSSLGPFPDSQVDVLRAFANQAVIAIENARLFEAVQARAEELTESLEYQTAISGVLQVISRSPANLQPVLDTIVETAVRLCEADRAQIFTGSNDTYQLVANTKTSEETLAHFLENPIGPWRGRASGRALLEGRPIHVPDVTKDAEYDPYEIPAMRGGARLAVPLVSGGRTFGVISLPRSVPIPFTQRQIDLVTTFADQAVIAIENARLFEAEKTRSAELAESLEYQTATSEVLSVISRSPNELQPVLDAIVGTAAELCEADFAHFRLLRDGTYQLAAANHDDMALLDPERVHPITMGRDSTTGRAAMELRTVHIPDVMADPEHTYFRRSGAPLSRTILAVPIVHEARAIGIIVLFRKVVRPFTERQIQQVTTFADQALIAIQNTRLFEEVQARTKELARSVEELKSLGEVGQAVSSTLDLGLVLQTVLENAARMAFASGGTIYVYDKAADAFHLEAGHNMSEEHISRVKAQPIRMGEPVVGECAERREAVQIADLAQADRERIPLLDILVRAGVRSILAVPLLHQGEVIGALVVRRTYAGAFTPETVRLLEAFAAQSAIAVHNARLFKEIEEKGRELALASKHKSQFVANMSHELRTPLAAILGYAELLQQGIYGELSEKSRGTVGRMQANGRHLLGLINTVLDISKIEAGQFGLNLDEYALGSLIETVRVATESLATEKKLALITDVAKGLPRGFGDEQRLHQVLLNLVGNAIKFTDHGEVRIAARAENGQFIVSVSDTGPGIPAGETERIFEEFHQVDSSDTRTKGGTGLGLAIAKRIVEMHGGAIEVESTPGRGATFHLRLPVRAVAAGGAP
jgi:signal transduction histidine kinase